MSHEPIDARFAEAWINYDHVVCGLRLRPYCLQHALLLTVLGNPLGVEDSKQEVTVGWEDLWEAVAVCCTAYEERPVFRGGCPQHGDGRRQLVRAENALRRH